MAFDGIVNNIILDELSSICGARIDKVFEPNKNTVLLGLYLNGINYCLKACIDASNCRIHLTTKPHQNPQIAPNFCMLLRKNLIGLKLKNIFTLDLERLIVLEFEGFDDIDNIISKKLIIELMGKHSNIILLDDNNVIIDCLRHIKDIDENFRDILPHTKYVYPTTEKKNFLEINNFEDFLSKLNLDKNSINNYSVNDISLLISNTFNGISKNSISAIINELDINELNLESLFKIYTYLISITINKNSNHLKFQHIKDDKGIIKDYYLKLSSLNKNENNTFPLNFFIDDFYYNKETSENFKNYRNSILKLILDTLNKYNKRLININKKLEECKDMDKFRIYGELLTANLYKYNTKNLDKVELENYYDNNNLITIQLDKKFSPSINARIFFKKYSKLKNALEIVSKQKEETLKDVNYIESVVYELEKCTTIEEIADIFDEISENSIFNEKTSKYNHNKQTKIKKSKFTKNKTVSFNPIKYNIDGYTVLVGRNNKENDYLTLKFSNKYDYWFHTKDIHGSHVILKLDNPNDNIDRNLLIKVSQIAAFHSKAQNSSNVPVEICQVKYIKKPSNSKPGMIIYTNNITLYVTPNNK